MYTPVKASEAGPLPHQGQGGKEQWRFFDDFASRYAMKDVFASSAWARRAELEFSLELAGLAQRFLGRVVDVGAGIAAPARFLQGRYSGYWAVDGSWAMVSAARFFHRHNPRFFAVTADAQAPPVREALFDVAFSIGALHHMDDPVQALRSVFRSLKPGGVLVVREPMRTNPLLQILRHLRMLVDRHYSRHQKFFRIGELTAMAGSAGFAVEKVAGYGLFSTPFAQVVLRPVAVTLPLSRATARLDQWLAKRWPGLSRLLSFNVVLVARRP